MFKSLVTLFAASLSIVSAQTGILSVTAPLQGTVYTAGQTALITWINPTVDTISQIVLANGPANALQPVMVIATNVSASADSFSWNIPANLTSGTDYALEFGQSPNMSFSGMFTIQGGNGTATNTSASASASVPATSSVAPSSSASAAGSSSAASTSATATAHPNDATRKSMAIGMVAMIVGTAVVLY
ncbi:Ser-Thr-rich glycosyl-phosphatidyl-inositol-anchored membrane family-domain-containing protein [Gongronella butleri]|nr:Ser-Thr-rich glycosyl-phosphatidyl-inositol-anchored membrane family-domain-containing protein [Gongronella butleri]